VSPSSSRAVVKCKITIFDKEEESVAKSKGCSGQVDIPDVILWWPQGMSENPGYLYTLKVSKIFLKK